MATKSSTWEAAGRSVRVTNLDRVYWPEDGFTKGDLLAYYRDVAPVLLPYIADRPVTLRVFPQGIHGYGHWRRDRPDNAPGWIRRAEYQTATDGHSLDAVVIDDAAGLIWSANSGGIEVHLWCSKMPNLAEPDLIAFDLDPGEATSFADVLAAARLVKAELDRLGMRAYPKTSGGRGLHIFLPLAPGHTFELVRDWVEGLAGRLEEAHPGLIATAHGSTHRGRSVTIDHAQNSIGRRLHHRQHPHAPGAGRRPFRRCPESKPAPPREVKSGAAISLAKWLPSLDEGSDPRFTIDTSTEFGPYRAHVIATIIQRSFCPMTSD
jgi:bifunctional non-homologous end joining protein LigD